MDPVAQHDCRGMQIVVVHVPQAQVYPLHVIALPVLNGIRILDNVELVEYAHVGQPA